jgi:transposase
MNQLAPVHVPQKPVREWRSVILYRHKLVDRRTSVRNAIHSILVAQGMAMPGRRRSVWSDDSMSRLRSLARPLGECATMDELWRGHLHMELEQLDELCRRVVVELDERLDAIGAADDRVRRLRTIPGVGPRCSELVVAMIDDPHRFKSVRQVGAYAGLVTRRYQSGEMDRSAGGSARPGAASSASCSSRSPGGCCGTTPTAPWCSTASARASGRGGSRRRSRWAAACCAGAGRCCATAPSGTCRRRRRRRRRRA